MLNLKRVSLRTRATLRAIQKIYLNAQAALFTWAPALLAALLLSPTCGFADPTCQEAPPGNGRKLRPGMEGQSLIEWVLIGGILVVIIVGLLTKIVFPQLEAILTSIMNTIQQNTTSVK